MFSEDSSESGAFISSPLNLALFLPQDSRYGSAIEEVIDQSLRNRSIEGAYIYIDQESVKSVIDYQKFNNFDCAIFLLEADRGISKIEIDNFQRIRELQIPTMILISSLIPRDELDDRWDFDDVVMLANRVLEPVVAPFLVLHDESGSPTGLYNLIEKKVLNYSSKNLVVEDPEDELLLLVEEFQVEFDQFDFDSDDFVSGLNALAIPFIPEKKLGLDQLSDFLTMLGRARF